MGSGESTLFWTDNWIDGKSIQTLAAALFGAVSGRRRRVLVRDALPGHAWVRHISGAFTVQVLAEFFQIWHKLRHVQLVSGIPDVFLWRLTADGSYSSASAYGAMFLGSSRPLGAKEIWKTSAPPKVHFFFWLVMHDCCWTAERRFRHGLQDSNRCIFCDQLPETMHHIIIGCVYSREVWHFILDRLHLTDVIPVQEKDVLAWWLRNRKLLQKHVWKGFDSLFFLIGWKLWKERNARTFGGEPTPPGNLACLIQEEADEWCRAGFKHLLSLLALL